MIRIYLILAFILQPVIGLGGIVVDRKRPAAAVMQSPEVIASNADTNVDADVDAAFGCCSDPQHHHGVVPPPMPCCVSDDEDEMDNQPAPPTVLPIEEYCGCAMQGLPVDNSAPAPVRFPAEKPIGQRLNEIASIVPVRALGSDEILFMLSSNRRFGAFRDEGALLSELSALEAHAVLCVWQT